MEEIIFLCFWCFCPSPTSQLPLTRIGCFSPFSNDRCNTWRELFWHTFNLGKICSHLLLDTLDFLWSNDKWIQTNLFFQVLCLKFKLELVTEGAIPPPPSDIALWFYHSKKNRALCTKSSRPERPSARSRGPEAPYVYLHFYSIIYLGASPEYLISMLIANGDSWGGFTWSVRIQHRRMYRKQAIFRHFFFKLLFLFPS